MADWRGALTSIGQGLTGGTSSTTKDKNKRGWRGAMSTIGQSLSSPDSYKKGGKVKKTGVAKVHKGERVLTKSQAKKYRKRLSK